MSVRVLAAVAVTLLVGCATVPPDVTAPQTFRDQSAPIASQTDITPARMAGDWVIRQRFAEQPGPRYGFTLVVAETGDLMLSERAGFCEDGICGESETRYLMVPKGPGRWQTESPSGTLPEGEIWVLWMDFDSRTAAIGTPGGEFGWIMDRSTSGGGDRITAARDIMDWFGYDMDRLKGVER